MKSQRNKKCLHNRKSVKGIKITVHTGIKVFNYAYKVSYVFTERFSQDLSERYFWFCKQHPPGLEKMIYPSMILAMLTLFEIKKYSSQYQQVM